VIDWFGPRSSAISTPRLDQIVEVLANPITIVDQILPQPISTQRSLHG
jgi:hypothetical protein